MDISMEIRKLPYSYIQQLSGILGSSFKELMAIIPKTLDKNCYKCDISITNPYKYNSEHLRLLENVSFRTQTPCLEILFCEWGASGRVRPALGHLLYLLIKAQLYRAADYVAIALLEQLPPIRPRKGPAALVHTTLPDLRVQEIKEILESLNYPFISYLMRNSLNTIRTEEIENVVDVRPKAKRMHSGSGSPMPTIENNRRRHMHKPNDNVNNNSLGDKPVQLDFVVPKLSMLEGNHLESTHILEISVLVCNDNVDTSNVPQASPLPNLSLNTSLPSFTYSDLKVATDCFDKTPYWNCQRVKGRFLGSGAFGSVYLGLNITDEPVAIKRLYLNNVNVVKIDDPVTKQFKNEVEILSKYRHENLVSLIGYSCDGPTYCLLHEFISGGSLKDRLQRAENRLLWRDRLHIALGTSKAISYLHTAFSIPLIHRDIKSANILLDCNNKPKLCDFGLTRMISSQKTSTHTCAIGTSAYMSSEAFRGDVSVKLDTFSFGVALLELITGLEPIDENREGCDIVTHVEEICEEDSIAPLIDLKAGFWLAKSINFAEELYRIAVKCLEQNKRKRPTMVEVTAELIELVNKV